MPFDINLRHLRVLNFKARAIFFSTQPCTDLEAGLGGCRANVFEHGRQRAQGNTGPIAAHVTEQAMFNRIPFGRARGIMANRYGNAKGITQARLNGVLPQPATVAIAAARITKDQQLFDLAVAPHPRTFEPARNIIDGKFGGIVRRAYDHKTMIRPHVVNPIRRGDGVRGGTKIVIANLLGFTTPRTATVVEVADEFFLFAIDTDRRLAGRSKAQLHLGDVVELPIAIRMARFGDGFAICFQRKVQPLLQQSCNGSWTRGNFSALEFAAHFARALARPFERAHRIARSIARHQGF